MDAAHILLKVAEGVWVVGQKGKRIGEIDAVLGEGLRVTQEP
jgi:hypothetical protein